MQPLEWDKLWSESVVILVVTPPVAAKESSASFTVDDVDVKGVFFELLDGLRPFFVGVRIDDDDGNDDDGDGGITEMPFVSDLEELLLVPFSATDELVNYNEAKDQLQYDELEKNGRE
jgi:hypothetical protein